MYGVPEFHSSGYLVLSAPPVFDLDAAPDVIDEVEHLAIWSAYMIMDLSRVEFISSPAVTVLVWAHRRLNALGGGLVLTGLSPTTATVLAVTGAAGSLTTYPTLDDVPARPNRTDPGDQPARTEHEHA